MKINLNNIPKNINGGITVIDKFNDDYTLLVGSSIKYKKKQYSLFGGHYQKRDMDVLHTSIREFVEELFNLKLKKDKILTIRNFLLKNNLLLDLSMTIKNSAIFFINFKTLEHIYNYIKHDTFDIKEKFEINKFNKERIWYDKNIVGLNEVEEVEGISLNNLLHVNSRTFTKDIADVLHKKLIN